MISRIRIKIIRDVKNRWPYLPVLSLFAYAALLLQPVNVPASGTDTGAPVTVENTPPKRVEQKDADEIAALRARLLMSPRPVRIHYELGLLYEKLGEYDKAVAEYKEGLKKHREGKK